MAELKLRKFVVRIDLRNIRYKNLDQYVNECLAKVNDRLTTAYKDWQATNNGRLVLKYKFSKFLEGFAIYEAREETIGK